MFGWGNRESKVRKEGRVYLDYAATTPVRPEVFSVMEQYFTKQFGNASSIHQEGLCAKEAIASAREKVARTLHVRPADIVFTSGGTESNNLALLGHVDWLLYELGVQASEIEVIATEVEHPSIANVLDRLKKQGVVVRYMPIDEAGRVVISEFEKLLSPKTKLVTVAYANSETGVVQDIGRIARTVRAYEKNHGVQICIHTDAAQAPLWLPCQPERLLVDMMSLDAGKCYGPKGVGVLVRRPKAKLSAVTYGGSQESGLRPGTENTALIVGCARAIEIAQEDYEERSAAIAAHRDHMISRLTTEIDDCVLNGSHEHRLANNVNISVLGIDSEFAVVKLDSEGVAASTRSACSGADGGGSQVVAAMTGDASRAQSTIRFSLGEATKQADVDTAVAILKEHVAKMRSFHKTLT